MASEELNKPDLLTEEIRKMQDEGLDDISDIRWVDAPVFIIFWGLLIIVFVQFFTRYALNDSLGWTEEIARYLLIMLGFVGSVTCIRKHSHIFLEFFYRFLPDRAVRFLIILVEVINVGFFGYAGVISIELAWRTRFQYMVSIDVSKGVIYWTVVASCFAMALTAAWNVYRLFKPESEELVHDIEEKVALD